MNWPYFLVIFCSIPAINLAQQNPDTLKQRELAYRSLSIDSLGQNLLQVPDSLLHSIQRIDSIRNAFTYIADSIQSEYRRTISNLDAQIEGAKTTYDSLKQLKLSTGKCAKKLNSLNDARQSREKQFTAKLEALKSKATDKLNALDLPPEYKGPLQNLTRNINDIKLDSDFLKIDGYKFPGLAGIGSLPDIDGIGDLTSKAGDIGKLSEIETPAGDLGDLSQQTQTYQEDIKNITQGKLSDVQALPATIEEQAAKIDGMEELEKQSGVMEEYKGQLDVLKDPGTAKEKVTEIVKEAAMDHFVGKEEALKTAMDKISKYKEKFPSASSVKDFAKRPPNPMKGKPFIERLIPGLYLQYQQKNFHLLDVNPYIGYKLSGRLTTGLGWNHRYAYERKTHTWNKRSIIFGPRGYVDFKLGKGFIVHLEGERMNTFVPSTLIGNPDTGHREWVWSFMTGLKKEYRIYKNLKGTALIQYNLFNRYYKAPYVDRLNSRIGFEYVLKNKKTKKSKP